MRPLSSASVVLALAASVVLLSSAVGHAQAPAPIFRLATFDANGDPRLGATVGNGEHDLLDVHNGIRYLMQSGAPEAQNLPYIPADMRTLAGAGPRATTAIRQVFAALAAQKAKGTLKDPGGAFRVFYPTTAVKFLAPVTNPSKIYGFAGNYPREGNLANPKFPSSFFKSVASLGWAGRHHRPGRPGHSRRARAGAVAGDRPAPGRPSASADLRLRLRLHGLQRCVVARPRPGRAPAPGATFDKGLDTFSPCGPYLTLKEDVRESAEPGDLSHHRRQAGADAELEHPVHDLQDPADHRLRVAPDDARDRRHLPDRRTGAGGAPQGRGPHRDHDRGARHAAQPGGRRRVQERTLTGSESFTNGGHRCAGARRFRSVKKCSTTETPSGAAFVGSVWTNRKREPSAATS